MREQVVGEQHRLRVLHVREAGRWRIDVPLSDVGKSGFEFGHALDEQPDVRTQEQPQIGRHLVVATAAGAQLAAERAEPIDQPALERGVHVLVGGSGHERARLAGGVEIGERVEHRA